MLRFRHALPAAVLSLTLAGCGPFGANQPPPAYDPSPPQLHCPAGDHSLFENEIGWGFCYPGGWKFLEKVQSSDSPSGLDATFDVTDAAPEGDPNRGKYGFMIVGTYERGSSQSLADWLAVNVAAGLETSPVAWGNAVQAAYVPSEQTWYALTAHHVVSLNVKSGKGNLDLADDMSTRLGSWLFTY